MSRPLRGMSFTVGQSFAIWSVLILGFATFGVGVVVAPASAWVAWLTSGFYFLTLSLGGMAFLVFNYLGKSGWFVITKRPAEALTLWIPFGGLSMLALVVGAPHLYHWAHHDAVEHDALLHAKAAYLNLPFWVTRTVIFVLAWMFFAYLLRRNSRAQDETKDIAPTRRNVAVSAVYAFFFAISFSFASFDWVMSREPHWYSTIFGWYNLAGVLLGGVAVVTVMCIRLSRRNLLPGFTEHHIHDLGKYLFAFATLWAYLWLSQFLLIWYSNLTEETPYYLLRWGGGWKFLFWLNLFANWVIPFAVLLPKPAKRSEGHVYRVALWILGARWLDIYLMAAPSGQNLHPGIGVLDLAVFVAFGSAFTLVLVRALKAAPLLPKGDPYLVETLHHHSA